MSSGGAASEKTPLLEQKSPTATHTRDRTSSFYFEKRTSKKTDSSYDAVATTQKGSVSTNNGTTHKEEEVDLMPQGVNSKAFSSRPVVLQDDKHLNPPKHDVDVSLLQKIFPTKKPTKQEDVGAIGTLLKQRKVPIKVEPKVFFANERTFIAWLHVSTILAGGSIAIVSFANANPLSQMYGIISLPIAISFIGYAMYQYVKRAAMIRRHDPGLYEDLIGPTVLSIMLMFSIVLQFTIKMYTLVYH